MISDDVKDMLDAGAINIRQMIRFSLSTGEVGFITGREPLTYSGVTYEPYSLFDISALSTGTGTSAAGGFTVKLASRPDDGFAPEVLKQIETIDYRDRPVTVYDAYFDPMTNALVQVVPLARGYIDYIEHHEDPEDGCYSIAYCEGRQIDYARSNGRVRSVADQKRRSSTDRFFDHAATAGRIEKSWGR